MTATGYEPLNTLKPVAGGLWIIDGPAMRQGWVPYPTRAVVVQLPDGGLWVYAPTPLTDGLAAEFSELGPVSHIVVPTKENATDVSAWRAAYPGARIWAPEGYLDGAEQLSAETAEQLWSGLLGQRVVRSGPDRREAVFCHIPSRMLIFAQLFEALETKKLPTLARPFVWFSGTDDSGGHMRPTHRWALKERDKSALAEDVEHLIGWRPKGILLSHGRCFPDNAVLQLERAFRKVLRAQRWEAAFADRSDTK